MSSTNKIKSYTKDRHTWQDLMLRRYYSEYKPSVSKTAPFRLKLFVNNDVVGTHPNVSAFHKLIFAF